MDSNTYGSAYNPQNLSTNETPVIMSLQDVKHFAGWSTFVAVVDIIAGALACLGIITAAYGIPMIIAGVRLLNAADELKRYISSHDTQKISYAFNKLYGYFKLTGISLIVKICFIILGIILYGVVIAMIISSMPDLMRNYPYPGGF